MHDLGDDALLMNDIFEDEDFDKEITACKEVIKETFVD